MKTKTINLYSFDELSKEAQRKALNSLSNIDTDHNWWDETYEDAKQIGLIITSFDDHKCTGYVDTTLNETCDLIIANHGPECGTYKLATDYQNQWAELVKKYSDGVNINKVTDENVAEFDDLAHELEKDFERDLLNEYFKILKKELQYLESDEAIIETIESNEYTFTENGKLENSDNSVPAVSKLNIYQTKVGILWVTWLGTTFQDRIENSPVMADAMTIGDSTTEFCKKLEAAIKAGTVSIFKGDVTLIDQVDTIRNKVRRMSDDEIKTELWHLGYRGVDILSEEEAFDKLVEYYEQNPANN